MKNLTDFTVRAADFYSRQFSGLGVNPHDQDDAWGFLPSRRIYIDAVVEFLKKIKARKKSFKIVDAGCGISPILMTLSILGYSKLTGVDIFRPFLVLLKQLIPIATIEIDLTKYNYTGTNFVYLYMPIKSPAMYNKKISKVLTKLDVGTYICDFYGPLAKLIDTKFKESYEAASTTDYDYDGKLIIYKKIKE